jgi:hypothetical protein
MIAVFFLISQDKIVEMEELKKIEEGKYTLQDYLNKIPAKRKKSHKDEYFST